jgi:hypothetical protein
LPVIFRAKVNEQQALNITDLELYSKSVFVGVKVKITKLKKRAGSNKGL